MQLIDMLSNIIKLITTLLKMELYIIITYITITIPVEVSFLNLITALAT